MPTIWTNAFRPLACVWALIALSACSSLEDQIPQDGPDMEAVYNEYTTGNAGGTDRVSNVGADRASSSDTGVEPATHRALIETSPALMSSYTRDASNEMEGLFKTHPNPTLFMYTRPHLVGRDGIPVPGYTTQFKMFNRDHFALPGEVQ